METMKIRRLLILACTGIASPLLILFALEAEGTKLGWLPTLIFGPGLFAARVLLPNTVHTNHSSLYSHVAFAVDLVLVWIVLLLVAILLEKLIAPRKKQA